VTQTSDTASSQQSPQGLSAVDVPDLLTLLAEKHRRSFSLTVHPIDEPGERRWWTLTTPARPGGSGEWSIGGTLEKLIEVLRHEALWGPTIRGEEAE